MDDSTLSKDAELLAASLYKSYLERRNSGISKAIAKSFGSALDIQNMLFDESSIDDISDTLRELGGAGLAICRYGDNTVIEADLTDIAIVYFENRFGNTVKKVLDFISSLTNLAKW